MALILKLTLQKTEEFWIVVVALLLACLLAAHMEIQYASFGVVGSYLYWIARILIEAAFFMAVLFAVEKYLKQLIPNWACYALAMIVSLIPFTLAITALDLIIGLPELGINVAHQIPVSRGWAFVMELFYLFDNHLMLCVFLLMPRMLLQIASQTENDIASVNSFEADSNVAQVPVSGSSLAFLDSIDPPMNGHICAMEAQEHYILVTTTTESRMVLHRFSDAVKQTSSALGMQAHRSHWVAHSAVQEVVVKGQSMKLKLTEGKLVPVSRTFRAAVESKYAPE